MKCNHICKGARENLQPESVGLHVAVTLSLGLYKRGRQDIGRAPSKERSRMRRRPPHKIIPYNRKNYEETEKFYVLKSVSS